MSDRFVIYRDHHDYIIESNDGVVIKKTSDPTALNAEIRSLLGSNRELFFTKDELATYHRQARHLLFTSLRFFFASVGLMLGVSLMTPYLVNVAAERTNAAFAKMSALPRLDFNYLAFDLPRRINEKFSKLSPDQRAELELDYIKVRDNLSIFLGNSNRSDCTRSERGNRSID